MFRAMNEDRRLSLADAAALVRSGDVLALGAKVSDGLRGVLADLVAKL